jgi:hypothetical protein
MACGSNKVKRPHTEQFFIAFGIEMVDLPLAASATARTKEARKETARKAYVKRKAQRDSAAGAGRDKSVLRPGSCGGLAGAISRPRSYQILTRATHARILLSVALASVPFGFVLVRVRDMSALASRMTLHQ